MFGFLFSRIQRYRDLREIYRPYPELAKIPNAIQEDRIHLDAALDWLMQAHIATNEQGVAAGFNLRTRSWGNAYRETTGYILPSLLLAADTYNQPDLQSAALKMAEWELAEQQEDGSYGELQPDGSMSKKIFNTGQVLLGLCVIARRTADSRFIEAAKRAADWLTSLQASDGSWDKYTTQGPRTYHAGVAWPLLEAFHLTKDERYLRAAERSLDWVLDQQKPNGWFEQTSLSHPDHPWTHLIVYTLRGLFESSQLLPVESRYKRSCLEAVKTASQAILNTYTHAKRSSFSLLPGTLDPEWKGKERYSCLTGDAQLAILWLKLGKLSQNPHLIEAAHSLIDDVKRTQVLISCHPEVRGGILGSFPIYGSYVAYHTLNWATKFFIDALLLKQNPDLDLRA